MHRKMLTGISLGVLMVGFGGIALTRVPKASQKVSETKPAIAGAATDLVRVSIDSVMRHIEVVIGPVQMPAGATKRVPVQLAAVPIDGYVRGFSWFVHDVTGRMLPSDLLHHVNLIDPDQSELFAPVARRVVAAGRETPAQSLPRVIGYPISSGTRFLVVSMFSNTRDHDYEAFLTVRINYVQKRAGFRPVSVFPFSLDVAGPVGDKEFAVPPGRTVRYWDGSPRIEARILGLGGHLHDYARKLELIDLTSNETLWSVTPRISNGKLMGVPRSNPWRRGGIKLQPDHRYRVRVEYFNPTSKPAPDGGMGVVAGIVATRHRWPVFDRQHPDYVADLQNVMMAGHGHH
jgi:hypothetical protein